MTDRKFSFQRSDRGKYILLIPLKTFAWVHWGFIVMHSDSGCASSKKYVEYDLYQFDLPAGMNIVRTRTVNSNVFIVVVASRNLDASNCPRSRTKNRFHE